MATQDGIATAHLGGIPELLVIVVPVVVFLVVRSVQFALQRRREAAAAEQGE